MSNSQTPDFMPVLSHGGHDDPKQGACFMEYASFIAGERFSDAPECVDPVIAMHGINCNDSMDEDERQKLLQLLPRVMNTAGVMSDEKYFTLALQILEDAIPAFVGPMSDFAKDWAGSTLRGFRHLMEQKDGFQRWQLMYRPAPDVYTTPGALNSDTEREKRGRYLAWVWLFESLTGSYILSQHAWESYTNRRTAQGQFQACVRDVVSYMLDQTYGGMVELLDMFESISGAKQSREPLHEDTLKKMVELTN